MVMRIYLDACCLNRPFDDQTQARIRLEAEAVLMILTECETGDWEWISSAVLDWEIEQMPDLERLRRIRSLVAHAHQWAPVGPSEIERAQELESWGISAYDALHLACAESGGAGVLLTTDDRLLRRSVARASELSVRVANPLTWLREVSET
jgi:predicted nucleic acid-binding protein